MRILVIVVTYNAMCWIDKCLGSVAEWDVFVVDNGSTDGTQEYIRSHFSKVLFRQCETNVGFGRANNIGLQYALDKGYDYVYLMNQDAWVMPGTISMLVGVSGKYPEYGVLSPMQMQADMRHIDYMFGKAACEWKYSREMIESWFNKDWEKEVHEVHFTNAAHWLVTRKCLMDVGGFSPVFPHYGEDNNYVDRVLFHNYKMGVVCRAVAVHDRRDRQPSKKEDAYYNCYIKPLIFLSNVSVEMGKLRRGKLVKQFALGVSAAGIGVTVKYWFKILLRYKTIRRSRERSMCKGSFLSVERDNEVTGENNNNICKPRASKK